MVAENFFFHIVRVFRCRLRPAVSSFLLEEGYLHGCRKFHFTHRSGVSLSFAFTQFLLRHRSGVLLSFASSCLVLQLSEEGYLHGLTKFVLRHRSGLSLSFASSSLVLLLRRRVAS